MKKLTTQAEPQTPGMTLAEAARVQIANALQKVERGVCWLQRMVRPLRGISEIAWLRLEYARLLLINKFLVLENQILVIRSQSRHLYFEEFNFLLLRRFLAFVECLNLREFFFHRLFFHKRGVVERPNDSSSATGGKPVETEGEKR